MLLSGTVEGSIYTKIASRLVVTKYLGTNGKPMLTRLMHAVCRTQFTHGLQTKFSAWFVLYEIQDTLYRSGHSFRTKSEGSREAEAEGAEPKFQSYQELSPGAGLHLLLQASIRSVLQ
jgi:hypothetical protein